MDEIETLLTRGVEKIYPSRQALEDVLRNGKKLRIFQGFDPTGIQFHIGHAVGLRKLRQWQDLGHHVIFLIGDGTGQAGDPSGKTRRRDKFLTREELRQNARDYVMQASKIVRFDGPNKAEILYNGDWLNKLTLVDILDIAGRVSFQQMVERDLYQERLKSGISMSLREFLYPLLQGYDSVAMNIDLEVGGVDQTFNMLMGRHLVKSFLNKEKFVMTVPLLTDTNGVKIGKTEGNVIGITDPPNEFFGKIMSLGDDAILPCFTLLTDISLERIGEMKREMSSGNNPMEYKKQLAYELTKEFHDEKAAKAAQDAFEKTFQKGKPTKDIVTVFHTDKDTVDIMSVLVESGLCKSKSEARRLIIQKGIDEESITINNTTVQVNNDRIYRVGKKRFLVIKKSI